MLEIDETIDRVGKLYHAVTGREPQSTENAYAAIPAEKDPVQYIEEQIDKLLLVLAAPGASAGSSSLWAPRVSLFESASEVAVCVDLPGVARERVSVNVDHSAVVVSGQRPPALPNGHVLCMSESPLGAFRRVVPLPRGLRVDDASALMRDGVLEIRIPRDGHRSPLGSRTVPVA